MSLSQLALILLYVGVLVIKTCDSSPEFCETYGFGATPKGTSGPRESLGLEFVCRLPRLYFKALELMVSQASSSPSSSLAFPCCCSSLFSMSFAWPTPFASGRR